MDKISSPTDQQDMPDGENDSSFRVDSRLKTSERLRASRAELQSVEEQLVQRNAELAIMSSLQAALASHLEIQDIYEAVGDKIREIFHNADVSILLYDPGTGLVHYPYAYEEGVRIVKEPHPLGDQGFLQHVVHTCEQLVINENLEQMAELLGEPNPSSWVIERSQIYMPFTMSGQNLGILSLAGAGHARTFSDADIRLLQTLTNTMSVALENIRLFEETQQLQKETEQRTRELAILSDIGAAMAQPLDIRALARTIGHRLREIFNAEIADILLFDSTLNTVRLAYSYSNPYFADEPPWQLGEEGLTARIILSRQPLLLNSAREMQERGAMAYVTTPESEPDPQSYLGVPIMVGDRVLGLVNVESFRPDAFTENHLRLLQTLSSNIGVALENARLFDESQRLLQETGQRAHELEAISKVSQALVAETELDGMIQLIGSQIRDIFDADIVYVALLDPKTNLIHFPYQVGESFVTLRMGEGYTSRIIQSGEPLLMNRDIDERSRELGVTRLGRVALSFLGVPIKAGGVTIGVISVQSTTREGLFTDDSLRLLTTIAANAGAAIHTAQLHAQTNQRAQEIATVAEIGREISSTLDLSTVLERIAASAMDLLHARDVVLRLVEPDGRLAPAVAIGKYASIYKNWDAQVGRGLSGSVAESGVAEIINNPEDDPRVIDIAGTEQDKINRAILFAPLLLSGNVIGVLTVWRDRVLVGPFTQADLDFAISLARQAAIAIQNARLFAETQQRFTETEILRAASVALTETLDLNAILGTLLEHLHQVVPYDSGSVFLLERETLLVARATRGYEAWTEDPSQAIGVSFDFTSTPHMRAIVEYQATIVIPDVREFPHWIVAPTSKHVRNWLAVPLVAGGKTIGMYSLDKATPGFFTPEHQRLAESLAVQAAIALQNATLYQNEATAREQAETLQAVTQALSRTLSLQEVFDLILTELQKVVPYDRCSVQQLGIDDRVIVGGRGFPNLHEIVGMRFKTMADDPGSHVIRTRQSHIEEDVSARYPKFRTRQHGGGVIHGWLGVPLIFGDRLIGMLAMDKYEKAFYTSGHAKLAMAFAAQAAVAIENARLFETERGAREQAEAQSRQMAALNRVAQAVTSTLNLQAVLDIAAREMFHLLHARSVGIGLLNDSRSYLRIVAYYSQGQEPSGVGLNIPVEGNLATQQVIKTGQSILITDAQNTPLQDEVTRSIMRARNTHCILLLPLLAHGEVIGTIGPDTDLPDRVFAPEEVQLAQTIANQMAGVIENARLFQEAQSAREQAETHAQENVRLFDETQRLLKQTEQRARELQFINDIGQIMTQGGNLNSVMERVGDKLRQELHLKDIRMTVIDSRTGQLVSPYVYRNGQRMTVEPAWLNKTDRVKQAIRQAKRTKGRAWIVHTNVEKSWRKYAMLKDGEEVPRSFLMLPLLAGGEVIGALNIPDYERENTFTDFPIGLLETIASNMGTAIQNVRLFEETRRLFKEAEEARAAAEQASQAKSTFLANMSHELRTPLNAIMGFTRIVRRKSEGVLPERQIENLDKVLISSEHLLGLINSVLEISKIEAGRVDVMLGKFDLEDLVDECITLAAPLLRPSVTLEKDYDETLGAVFSDEDKIKQILLNLLSNAAKFTHAGGILISVQKLNEESLSISVKDSGIGISEEALGRIFEQFQQADPSTTRQYGGTGLGLSISRSLAHLLGGDLLVSSQMGQGSTFTLILPIQYRRRVTLQPVPVP